jgi:selenide, water dikinase
VDLGDIVRGLAERSKTDPNLLVGFDTGDDAGVYRLTDEIALVQTVDYITPVVDDPFLFGQVAAANALSDVYAMGGRPLTALNLCNFPAQRIDHADLRRILEGGFDKVAEAGATVVGGHTVRDDELKYGLSVTGLVHPKRVLTNTGAKPGDALVLTKPIGTGVIVGGRRRGLVPDDLLERAVASMTLLNRAACEIMLELGAGACTDVTGFGLLGHALGMARGSGVLMRFRFRDLPRYEESVALISQGVGTVMTASNAENAAPWTTFSGAFWDEERTLLADPQTSGGLLIALPAEQAAQMVERARASGAVSAAVVGEVVAPPAGRPGLEILK